ncbi:MAG: IS1380 family transposase, partial [Clostridia bacterium]|nr:IS1380 family transposase [Clostridia bacterium]
EWWLQHARRLGTAVYPREGKTVYTGTVEHLCPGGGETGTPVTAVFSVTVRTTDAQGQAFLMEQIEVDTWWTSLGEAPETVIELYEAHGTSEQFHSELKTDMDIERLPSGHFASNSLVLHLAMITYNSLRIIGQQSLEEARRKGIKLPGSRSSKHVERRRIGTVIQDLMYMAGRLVYRGRQWYIGFGCLNPFAELWRLIDTRLRGVPA